MEPPPARIMFPLAVAGVLFTVNLALGVATFGLQHAVNESREWLYLLITTAFVVAAGPWTSRFWRPWYALAFGAMGLAWLGVAKHGVHSATSQIVINGQLVDGRPLNSAGAAALAFALIVLLGSRTISVRRKIVFGTAAIMVNGSNLVWSLRRQLFEARNIGRYKLKRRLGSGGLVPDRLLQEPLRLVRVDGFPDR